MAHRIYEAVQSEPAANRQMALKSSDGKKDEPLSQPLVDNLNMLGIGLFQKVNNFRMLIVAFEFVFTFHSA